MTKNQIEFNKLREVQRANRIQEAQTALRDQRTHDVATAQLGEATRHNKATEIEARRHNVSSEGISQGQLDETRRANYAREEIDTKRLAETATHNRASEVIDTGRLTLDTASQVERSRHNLAMEAKDLSPKVNVTATPSTSTPVTVNVTPPQGSSTTLAPQQRPNINDSDSLGFGTQDGRQFIDYYDKASGRTWRLYRDGEWEWTGFGRPNFGGNRNAKGSR